MAPARDSEKRYWITDMRFLSIDRIRRTPSGLLLCLSVALAIRLLVLMIMADRPINNDGVIYVAAAQQLAHGDWRQSLAIYPMPLVPILIATMHLIVPDWLTAGRLVSFAAVVLALIPLYRTTDDLFGSRAAFFCGLAYAVAPFTTEFVNYVLRGGPYFFFLCWAVYFAQRGMRRPGPLTFACGALFSGAAGLCRVEGIAFVAIATSFFCICLPLTPRGERGRLLQGIAAWSAVFILALAALVAAMGPTSLTIEGLTNSSGGFKYLFQHDWLRNYHELYGHLKELGKLSPYPSGNQNFAEIARHWIPLIYLIGLIETLIGVVFLPFFFALIVGLRHTWTRSSALLMWTVVWYLLIVHATHISRDFIQTRFLFAPAFLLYPWVGRGMERISQWLPRCSWPRLAAALFAIFFVVSPLVRSGYMIASRDPLLADAGRWIRQSAELATARKFFSDARIAYHAGQDWLEYEDNYHRWQAGGKSMEEFARSSGIEVVVPRYSSRKRPEAWGDFKYYKKYKEFTSGKDVVQIYLAPRMERGRQPAVEDALP